MNDLYARIDKAIDALTRPLSQRDLAAGWTLEQRQWWLGYLGGLRDGILATTDFDKSRAPFHLARLLDHQGVAGSRLASLIIDVQPELQRFKKDP